MLTWPAKDPDEVIDYFVNWAKPDDPRLDTGETLLTSNFTVAEGTVVINSSSFTSTMATVWLSGGTDGEKCVILNQVTTSLGRTYDQSVTLRIRSH